MSKTFTYYQDRITSQNSILDNIVAKAPTATIENLYRLCTGMSMLQLTRIDHYRPDVSESVMSRIAELLTTSYTMDESALLDKCFDIITTEPLTYQNSDCLVTVTSTDGSIANGIGRRRFEDFGFQELENSTL
jgi:hypothetical protein